MEENLKRRIGMARLQAVVTSTEQLVSSAPLLGGEPLPLALQPVVGDIDMIDWARANAAQVSQLLLKHGGLLFRGFKIADAGSLEQFMQVISTRLISHVERSSPRTHVCGAIYTSTDHPASQRIHLHNEQSYTNNWPMKIAFFCQHPPDTGGATPIADCRRVYAAIDPAIREQFSRRKVMYIRNYGSGLGLPWQVAFQTEDKAAVETYCREANIMFEWRDGDWLRTRQIREATAIHPQTGEDVWFNHAYFFHFLGLEPSVRESLLAVLDEESLPTNTYYGDGSPVEPEVIEHIGAAYQGATVRFSWQAGDILLLDNMLVAHGRESFTGPRQVLVAIADPIGDLHL